MYCPVEFSLEIINLKFSDKPAYLNFKGNTFDFTFSPNKNIPIFYSWKQENLNFPSFFYLDPTSENPILINKHNFLGYFILNQKYIGIFYLHKMKDDFYICYFSLKDFSNNIKLLKFFEKYKIQGLFININIEPIYIKKKQDILLEDTDVFLEIIDENNENIFKQKDKILNIQTTSKSSNFPFIFQIEYNTQILSIFNPSLNGTFIDNSFLKKKKIDLYFDMEENNYKEESNNLKYNLWKGIYLFEEITF